MSDQYYTEKPASKSEKKFFKLAFMGADMTFATDAGVFSKGELDKGTELLLTHLPKLRGEVLDLGCGWGPIGVTLLKTNPDITVTMADINERAVELAKENLALNGVSAQVIKSDGFLALEGRVFSAIVTNPPIRAGKRVIYDMFQKSRAHLTGDGALYVVIRKQQGADSAIAFLKTVYETVTVLKKSGGFCVIEAKGRAF